jgi:biopolymer transport protein ExbB
MEGLSGFWGQSDFISRSVALLLLAMSVSSWVIVLWKGWLLRRAGIDIRRGRLLERRQRGRRPHPAAGHRS